MNDRLLFSSWDFYISQLGPKILNDKPTYSFDRSLGIEWSLLPAKYLFLQQYSFNSTKNEHFYYLPQFSLRIKPNTFKSSIFWILGLITIKEIGIMDKYICRSAHLDLSWITWDSLTILQTIFVINLFLFPIVHAGRSCWTVEEDSEGLSRFRGRYIYLWPRYNSPQKDHRQIDDAMLPVVLETIRDENNL